jgi:uncharacterized phage-associated protein
MANDRPVQLALVPADTTSADPVREDRGQVRRSADPQPASLAPNNGHNGGESQPPSRAYARAMGTTARDIAAAIRERLPHVGEAKMHKLLYYCAGHHLAMQGKQMFPETIAAWDEGPVVVAVRLEPAGDGSTEHLTEAELNTVGYVASRYGKLTGNDLTNLTKAERPWRTADAYRRPGGSIVIQDDWLREYFRAEGAPLAGDERPVLDSRVVTDFLAGAQQRFEDRYGKTKSDQAEEDAGLGRRRA